MLLCVTCCGNAHASAADDAFELLGQKYLDDLTHFSPVNATLIGDHRADDRLDDVNAAARDRALKAYKAYLGDLSAIDRDQLSRANQVDLEVLRNEIESSLWSLDTLQEWAWNPLVYVDLSGSAIYGLVARDFAPLNTRLRSAAARLEQLPRFFAQARESIQPARVPKIHAETAVQQNPGLVSIIETMIVPEMTAIDPAIQERLNAAIETAKDAIAEQQTWLEEELLPRAAGDFRVGAELFDAKLAFVLDSPLGRREIKARAESVTNTLATSESAAETNPFAVLIPASTRLLSLMISPIMYGIPFDPSSSSVFCFRSTTT